MNSYIPRSSNLLAVMVLIVVLACSQPASALSLLSDSVSAGFGITATIPWSTSASLSWTITHDATNPFPWKYEYTWTTLRKDLSHIIIEVTTDAPATDFSSFSPSGALAPEGPRLFTPGIGNSNPGMPAAIYGIKFDIIPDTTNLTFSLRSTHSPTWGDFYAKDGKQDRANVYAYNTGFSAAGAGCPACTSGGLHIAVPNGAPVPEPSSLLLLGVALAGLGFVSQRRLTG